MYCIQTLDMECIMELLIHSSNPTDSTEHKIQHCLFRFLWLYFFICLRFRMEQICIIYMMSLFKLYEMFLGLWWLGVLDSFQMCSKVFLIAFCWRSLLEPPSGNVLLVFALLNFNFVLYSLIKAFQTSTQKIFFLLWLTLNLEWSSIVSYFIRTRLQIEGECMDRIRHNKFTLDSILCITSTSSSCVLITTDQRCHAIIQCGRDCFIE